MLKDVARQKSGTSTCIARGPDGWLAGHVTSLGRARIRARASRLANSHALRARV